MSWRNLLRPPALATFFSWAVILLKYPRLVDVLSRQAFVQASCAAGVLHSQCFLCASRAIDNRPYADTPPPCMTCRTTDNEWKTGGQASADHDSRGDFQVRLLLHGGRNSLVWSRGSIFIESQRRSKGSCEVDGRETHEGMHVRAALSVMVCG